MIFSMADHIEQIKNGSKTQTRRQSKVYLKGKTYSVQPGRTKPGIEEGRILIVQKRIEQQPFMISFSDAKAEGDYIPEKFEALYSKMYPGWTERYAYTFRFISRESIYPTTLVELPSSSRKTVQE